MSFNSCRNIVASGMLGLCVILTGCTDDEQKVAAKITSQPGAQTVLPDSTAVFGVVASGSGTVTYQWLRGGVTIPGANLDTLRVSSVYHDSIFRCIADNGVGADTSTTVTFYLAWPAEHSVTAGAQGNASGTALDLDVPEAMQTTVAYANQGAIDLLFVYSAGTLKLMSPVAAKLAGDISFAANFNGTLIQDVLFVKVPAKPANQEEGKAAYDTGSPTDSASVAANDVYIVKTSEGKYVRLTVTSIQGSDAVATMNLAVSFVTL